MKLHLGCGQIYLDGYVNIDFPPSEHSVQGRSVADQYADLRELKFAHGSVEEVRLHHVFEHFRRQQAAALVASWNSWMCDNAVLNIEVPDIRGLARVFVNPFSSRRARSVAERHLFGSHEAGWAAHYEGYDASQLKFLLNTMGFEVVSVKHARWRGTHNLHVVGRKRMSIDDLDHSVTLGRIYLSQFRVDDSEDELKMVDLWVREFEAQVKKTWAE